jgi:autotransporter-associated beta strand protein
MTNRTLKQSMSRAASNAMLALIAFLLAPAAQSASTWVGLGGDDNWSTPANWDSAPVFPAALTFGGATRLSPTNDVDGATVTNITFAAGAGAFALKGNAITLGGNVNIAIGTGVVTNDQVINLPITLNTSPVLRAAPVPGHFANNKGVLVFNGVISGSYGVTSGVTGTGSNYVQFNGSNTYTGDTLITGNDASFSIGNANAFGSGKLIVGLTPGESQMWIQTVGSKTVTNTVEIRTQRFITANYTIAGKGPGNLTLGGNVLLNQNTGNDFWCQTPLTISGTLSGGNLNGLRMASGTVILQGKNTFTNHVSSSYAPSTPTVNINSDAALGHTNNNVRALTSSLILQTASSTSITTAPSRAFTVSADKTIIFDIPSGSMLTVPGLISGGTASSNTLSKTGAGTLILPNANTYIGGTVLSSGTLNISAESALGSTTGALSFVNSATLQTAASNLVLNAGRNVNLTNAGTYAASFDVPTNCTLTVAGAFRGNVATNSALTKTSPGRLILTGGTVGSPLGGMNVQGGTLTLQSGMWYTAPANTSDSTVFNVTGGATYEQTGGTNYIPYYSCVSQQFIGGSTTNMTSVAILSGGAMVGYEFMIGRRNSAVMTISSNAVLDLYALKLGELPGFTTTFNLDGGVVDCNYIATRDTNTIAQSASILNFNGGTLRAKNTAGTPNVIGGYGSGTVSYLTKVNVKSGGAIIDSRSYAVTIPQVLNHDADLGLSLDGGLTKRGTGTLTLATTNTYNGLTTVEAGALKLGVDNAVLAGGYVLVASNAVFDVNGKVETLAGLGGSGVVTNNSLLTVSQGVAPGGTNAIGTLTLAATPAALSGLLVVDVATNGACDRLHVQGNLNLSGLSLSLANPEALAKSQKYVIASCTGTLTPPFISAPLPDRWHAKYDLSARQAYLSYDFGALLMVR